MKPTGKSLKVLIVEDSEDDALLMVDELKRGGFDLVHKRVETKPGFIEELSRGWELILADYSLPLFSGDEALKTLNASGRDIPLIVISGSITEEIVVSLLKSGARDFVAKNNLSRLVPAVQRELDEASTRKTRRLLIEKLREKEEQSRLFFNSANEAFILLDKELRFIQVNPTPRWIHKRGVKGQKIR